MSELTISFPEELIEAIVERVRAILALTSPDPRSASPYLTTEEAAAYLRCKRQRIHDLLTAGRLSRFKDGRRTLVLRAEIEELVELDRRRRR